MEKKPKIWSHSFLDDFKNWMEQSEEDKNKTQVKHCKSASDEATLIESIDCPFRKYAETQLAKSFMKHGGVIKEECDDLFLVKTKKGKFYIKKELVEIEE
jgi:hypothetical protein